MSCENTNPCTCEKTACPRHGRCCECVRNHRELGSLPHCFYHVEDAENKLRNLSNKIQQKLSR